MSEVLEDKIEFNAVSDRITYSCKDEEGKYILAQISGYDLQIAFNMDLINTNEDVDLAASSLAALFKEHIISQMLSERKG